MFFFFPGVPLVPCMLSGFNLSVVFIFEWIHVVDTYAKQLDNRLFAWHPRFTHVSLSFLHMIPVLDDNKALDKARIKPWRASKWLQTVHMRLDNQG